MFHDICSSVCSIHKCITVVVCRVSILFLKTGGIFAFLQSDGNVPVWIEILKMSVIDGGISVAKFFLWYTCILVNCLDLKLGVHWYSWYEGQCLSSFNDVMSTPSNQNEVYNEMKVWLDTRVPCKNGHSGRNQPP